MPKSGKGTKDYPVAYGVRIWNWLQRSLWPQIRTIAHTTEETLEETETVEHHNHNVDFILPDDMTGGSGVVTGGAADVYGAWVEIISAANLQTEMGWFDYIDCSQAIIDNPTGMRQFGLEIGYGTAISKTVIARTMFNTRSTQTKNAPQQFQQSRRVTTSPSYALYARCKDSNGTSTIADLWVLAHGYPPDPWVAP